MAISDLTGTKWYFNSGIITPSTALNLNFYSNGLMYNQIYTSSSSIMYYNSTDNPNSKVIDDGWTDQAYRFISITGGTDATSQTTISWLQSNATLLPVINLTGTTWIFNSTITNTIGDDYYYINFDVPAHSSSPFDRLRWHFGSILEAGSTQSTMYIKEPEPGTWVNDSYRTWTVTDGTDVTNLTLITWFAQNATYQGTSSGFQSYQICLKQPLDAYTLTWDNGITVTVNGNSVSQGYELQDGDIILATVGSSLSTAYAVINSITYNAPADISLDDTNIHISYYIQGSGGTDN